MSIGLGLGSELAHNGISVRTHHAPCTQDTADLLVSCDGETAAEQLTAAWGWQMTCVEQQHVGVVKCNIEIFQRVVHMHYDT